MPKLSRFTKSALALVAGGAALIGIGATHPATAPRIASLTGGSSSSSQTKGGRSSTSSSISNSEKEYAEICYDPASGQRLENDQCEESNGSSGGSGVSSSRGSTYWISYSNSAKLPKVGEQVSGGSSTRPSDGTIFRNLSSEGGSFADSFKESRSSYTVQDSQVVSRQEGSSNGGFKSSTNTSQQKSGFGSGFKTGGGSKGG